MKNADIAKLFGEIADLLEIRGENVFRIRAYRRAAQNIESYPEDIAAAASRGGLEAIPGIGKDLAGKIQEYLSTGTIAKVTELRGEIPPGVLNLLDVRGLGPKTA